MSCAASGPPIRARPVTTSSASRRFVDELRGVEIMACLVCMANLGRLNRRTVPPRGPSGHHGGRLWNRAVRHRRHCAPTVTLEQALMSGREEREPIEEVLVVDLDASGQTGRRVAGDDQADQHRIHIHLMAVWGGPAAKATPVWKAGVDRCVDG